MQFIRATPSYEIYLCGPLFESRRTDMNPYIHIEKVRPDDAAGVADVLYQTWLATYPSEEYGITEEDIEVFYEHAFEEDVLEKQREKYAHMPENEAIFVAKDVDTVVGMCRVVRSETHNTLRALYVLPAYHRMGIGESLWREVRAHIDPKKDTVVDVAVYNAAAQAFYKHLGFHDTGERMSEERFRFQSGAIIPEMRMVLPAHV